MGCHFRVIAHSGLLKQTIFVHLNHQAQEKTQKERVGTNCQYSENQL